MTTKTQTKSMTRLPQLFSVIALLAIMPIAGNAFATNTSSTSWASGTQTYECTSDLQNGLSVTANVDICDDLQAGADKWNNVSSSTWDISESGSSDIPVESVTTLASQVWAVTWKGTDWTGYYVEAYMDFNGK